MFVTSVWARQTWSSLESPAIRRTATCRSGSSAFSVLPCLHADMVKPLFFSLFFLLKMNSNKVQLYPWQVETSIFAAHVRGQV